MRFIQTLLLTLSLALVACAEKPELSWKPYSKAFEAAKQEKKYVFVDAVADWCMPCKIMEQTTYRDEEVIALIKKHFVAAKLDVDQKEAIACPSKKLAPMTCAEDYWKLDGIPGTIVLDENGKLIESFAGMLDHQDMLAFLKPIVKKISPAK